MICTVLGVKIRIDFLFTATVAMLALIDTQGIMWMSFAAVTVHELGHIAVMKVLRVKIRTVRLSCCGVLIDGGCCDSLIKSIAVALAGPLVNYIVYFAVPHTAFGEIMLATALFNMIPVLGTDGGDILRIICCRFFEYEKSKIVFAAVSISVSVLMLAYGVALTVMYYNPTLLASAVYFIAMTVASLSK